MVARAFCGSTLNATVWSSPSLAKVREPSEASRPNCMRAWSRSRASEPVACVGREVSQGVDGADALGQELLPAECGHPAHHQEVPVGLDLLRAVVAAPAVRDAGCQPLHRPAGLPMSRRQGAEPVTALAENGQEIRQGMQAPDVVAVHHRAEHQCDRGGRLEAHPDQLVPVRCQLQEGAHLGVPGQLGVPDFVPAGAASSGSLVDDEVGVAEELAVEEGCLEHHVRPGPQRQFSLGLFGHQVRARGLAPLNRVHPGAAAGIPCAVAPDQSGEDLGLVLVTQGTGTALHFVVGKFRLGRAAQLLVKDPERAVLTLAGSHEVGGGKHQVRFGRARRHRPDQAGTRGPPH